MEFAAVVILYKPDVDSVRNILSYAGKASLLLVYDNSPLATDFIKKSLAHMPNLVYVHSGENEGIAKRLNEACQAAAEAGFEYLLTMDQDSYFEQEAFDQYLTCINQYSKIDSVAMFGVHYDHQAIEQTCSPISVTRLITSGSMINLKNHSTVGAFEEKLFIDEVDHEYCYRAKLKGFELIQFHNILLMHQLGEIKVIPGLKKGRRIYSPTRMYYIVRNYFFIQKYYGKSFPEEIAQSRSATLVHIKNSILFGTHRSQTVKMIIKGFQDFKRNNWGQLR